MARTKNWPTVFESVGSEVTSPSTDTKRTFRDHILRYLFCARRSWGPVTRRGRVGGRGLRAGGVAPTDEQ